MTEADKIISMENHFPSDILPTGYFLSRMQGFKNQAYGLFIGEGKSTWSGMTVLGGEQMQIRIAHLHQSTSFLLTGEKRAELWEMEEKDCKSVSFNRKRAIVNGTLLSPSNTMDIPDTTHSVDLNFCEGRVDTVNGRWCKKCPFQDKELQQKGTHQRQNLFGNGHYKVIDFIFSNPGDLPMRRVRDLDKEKSEKWLKGFENLDEAISTLFILRDAIKTAVPLLTSQSAPTPSSQSLISDRWFQ